MIINDFFVEKGEIALFKGSNDEVKAFNRKVEACVNMYRFLEVKGILEKVSFRYKKEKGEILFALDTEKLKPYRKIMEQEAKFKNKDIAIKRIFDEKAPICLWCGSTMPSWTMKTYRDNGGVVSGSVECWACQSFHLDILTKAHKISEDSKKRVAFVWDKMEIA